MISILIAKLRNLPYSNRNVKEYQSELLIIPIKNADQDFEYLVQVSIQYTQEIQISDLTWDWNIVYQELKKYFKIISMKNIENAECIDNKSSYCLTLIWRVKPKLSKDIKLGPFRFLFKSVLFVTNSVNITPNM